TVVFEMSYDRRRSAPVIQGPVRRDLITRYGADLVIIAIPLTSHRFFEAINEALAAHARVAFVPPRFVPSGALLDYDDIDGVLLARFGNGSHRRAYEAVKRIGDILASIFILVLGAPVFLMLSLLIKLDSDGPVLFCQERVGRHGRPFQMY